MAERRPQHWRLSWPRPGQQQQCDQMRLGADGPPFLWTDVLRASGMGPGRELSTGTQAGHISVCQP